MHSPALEPEFDDVSNQLTSTTPPVEVSYLRRHRVVLVVGPLAALVAIAIVFAWLGAKKHHTGAQEFRATAIQSGGSLRLTGTTQAVETRSILAPVVAGKQEGTLTITRLMPAGSRVKAGDLLVEFDRQAQMLDFIDKQAQTDKLTGDMAQEQAKQEAARAKDESELKVAEDALATAKLEMQKIELMSKIDAEKAQETLDEAKATAEQLKQTLELKHKAGQAAVRILEIQRDRASETMLHAQGNAASMQIHAPIDGVVVLNTIWKEGTMGEVQEGDQVRPGMPFMQVVDPARMEVKVAVNQQDVLRLSEGQSARIHLDAYQDLVCPGELEVVDPLGQPGPFSPKVRTFSALFTVKCTDPRLLPGLSAAVDLLPKKGEKAP